MPLRARQGKSPSCQVCWLYTLRWWRDNGFNLSCELAGLHAQRFIWPYGWGPLIISHIPAKFSGHRHCHSKDIQFLVVKM